MQNKKKKIAYGFKYFWLNLLGRERQIKVLTFLSKTKALKRTISFNTHILNFRKVLVILPEKPFEVALTQRCIIALKEHRTDMVIDVLAESDSKDIICSNPFIDSGLFYAEHEYRYNHTAFKELVKTVQAKGYDACFLMKQEPNPLDLLVSAVTMAPLRLGFTGAGHSPFINLSIRPRKEALYEGDKYESLLKTIGVKLTKSRLKWNIPRTTEKDVEAMITEAGYDARKPLIGVNVTPGITGRGFPMELLKQMLSELALIEQAEVVLFQSGEKDEAQARELASGKKSVVMFSEHHITTAAAFACRCAVMISLNNLFYQVAVMLTRPVVGVFESLDHRRWGVQEEGKCEIVSAVRLKAVSVQELVDKTRKVLG